MVPKWDYGMILIGRENKPGIVLHITDSGIVRMDYILDDAPGAPQAIFERDA
ncbi:MAG: hypothetical protein M3R47_07380 [Chloroflexota bacterium]|nr:hypothetical protein [Chloroflexota bacterium]